MLGLLRGSSRLLRRRIYERICMLVLFGFYLLRRDRGGRFCDCSVSDSFRGDVGAGI